MSDELNSNRTQDQPKKRRSRRATAPVTSPEAALVAPTTQPEPAQQGEPAEPVAEKPKRAPRKRAPKAAVAEVPDVEAAAPVAEPEAAAPVVEQPRRQRGRRRAVSGGGTPEEAPPLDVFAAFGRTPIEDEAPAKKDAPALDLEVPAREGDQTDRPKRSRGTRGKGKKASESGDAAPEEPENAYQDAAEDDSPRLPATALLFQAPEPARGRRRRPAADSGAVIESEPTDVAQPDDEQGAKPSKKSRAGGKKKDAVDRQDETAPSEAATDEGDDSENAENVDNADSNENNESSGSGKRRRRRGGRGRRKSGGGNGAESGGTDSTDDSNDKADTDSSDQSSDSGDNGGDEGSSTSRRRRRRRSRGSRGGDDPKDEVTALKGSTRLEAKRQRRREGRDSNRRRSIITEAEFLARRESVNRSMVVRERDGRTQIAVLEDGVLVEHYVAKKTQSSVVGNVYLGRVQNVLPSMEAAFVDLGKGRNAVLYAGEVNWDAVGLEGQPRKIEQALTSGDSVLVQVTKDPIGHKGARLTAQVTLAGRFLVLVPSGSMTGISRKLPDTERNRLKKLLREILPEGQGVIVRTAAEGASEEALRQDVERLTKQWEDIQTKVSRKSTNAPVLLKGEPELSTRVVRDVFNEDFATLVVAGDEAWKTISEYVESVAPDLTERLTHWTEPGDVFAAYRIDEQLSKGMDRKVMLPSGGSLVIDRTEAMTVVDVNTGKFTGSGGTLEETVTKNNIEAAEEIVRQLRLRDIGGIIVIDFIDMVLEANRDLVMRRLVECLGRDRTRHQVAEVTSLGLIQMTRKRVGQGLVEAFSETCDHCNGRGFLVHSEPVESNGKGGSKSNTNSSNAGNNNSGAEEGGRSNRRRKNRSEKPVTSPDPDVDPEKQAQVRATLATIAAAAAHAHEHETDQLSESEQEPVSADRQQVSLEPAFESALAAEASIEASSELPISEPSIEVTAPQAEPATAPPEAETEPTQD